MSFIKITAPKKRDLIASEFRKTKRNIPRDFMAERLGESDVQRELSKVLKPITDTQEALKEIVSLAR